MNRAWQLEAEKLGMLPMASRSRKTDIGVQSPEGEALPLIGAPEGWPPRRKDELDPQQQKAQATQR